jgi:hypothetical protein
VVCAAADVAEIRRSYDTWKTALVLGVPAYETDPALARKQALGPTADARKV